MPRPIPTVGRKVWYFPDHNASEPQDATIIKGTPVEGIGPENALCNLFVISPLGQTSLITDVQAFEDSDPSPYPHFRWMPYQVSQVVKEAEKASQVPQTLQKL